MSIRVLIVDDSRLFRRLLRTSLESLEGVCVVGEAPDGQEGLRLIEELRPDFVTLDVEMPVLDGLGMLERLGKGVLDLRILLLSSLTTAGAATTVRGLCLGASDFLLKPREASVTEAAERLRTDLRTKIDNLFPAPPPVRPARAPVASKARRGTRPGVLGIGVSTGGPKALHSLLGSLPENFPLPILVVQHMPEGFTAPLAQSLDQHSALRVAEARTGMLLEPGVVLLAPGGRHLDVRQAQGVVSARVHDQPPEGACRPSANVMLRSLAEVYGPATLALIMTGVGEDGLDGCQKVSKAGGTVITQDQASSAVYGMPRSVVDAGLAVESCALADLGETICRLVGTPHEAR